MEDECFNGSSSRQQYKRSPDRKRRTNMEGECFNGSTRKRRRMSPVSKHCGVGNQPKHSNKGVSFIKVLGREFNKKLQIPQEFIRPFNGCIPQRFILESAITQKCWRVEVEEDFDGRMFLGQGWGAFVEAHMLESGNFLIFEYEEQSIFQVKIYRRNGCEKTFLDTKLASHQNLVATTVSEEDGEREASDHVQKILKKNPREETGNLSSRKCKSINMLFANSRSDEQGKHKKQHTGDMDYIGVQSDKLGHERTRRVLISEDSVCFSVTIHKAKNYQFYQLPIPKAICLEKKLSSKEKAVLQDAKGKCWPVKLLNRKHDRDLVYLGSGWRNFLLDNEIVHGDTIDLKFITDDRIEVHVTRASEVEHQCGQAKCQNEASEFITMDCEDDEPDACTIKVKKVEASDVAKRVPSEARSSSFSLIWRRSFAYGLYVPKPVAEDQDLKNKECVMLRDLEGKCWPLEVRTWSDGRVGFMKGWSEFRKGHGIRIGDFLSFKFMSDCLIQVTINRGEPLKPATEGVAMNSEAIDNEGIAIATQIKEIDDGEGAAVKLEKIDIDD